MIHEAGQHRLELQDNPLIAVNYDGPEVWASNITEIAIGAGRIAVAAANSLLTEQQMRCAVLASVGLQNPAIAGNLYISRNTVKIHIKNTLQRLAITRRSQIAPTFLEKGIYTVTERGNELGLSDTDKDIVGGVAIGRSDQEIVKQFGMQADIPHRRLKYVSAKTGFIGREIIGLAAFLSGEVGYANESLATA